MFTWAFSGSKHHQIFIKFDLCEYFIHINPVINSVRARARIGWLGSLWLYAEVSLRIGFNVNLLIFGTWKSSSTLKFWFLLWFDLRLILYSFRHAIKRILNICRKLNSRIPLSGLFLVWSNKYPNLQFLLWFQSRLIVCFLFSDPQSNRCRSDGEKKLTR